MLISKKKNFLFYHVYKVAGSSIRNALMPYCSKKQVFMQNLNHSLSILGVNFQPSPINSFHPLLKDVKEFIGEESFDSYYKFSFVRHPLDWQKSLYYFMKKNKRHHQHNLISSMSFDEYIKWRVDQELNLMSDLVSDDLGNILLDDIYRFENIKEDFEIICNSLNIVSSLPHKNVAGKGRPMNISDPTLKEFKEAFSKDYSIFGYK